MESDGSTTGPKEFEISGHGLPYAPEDFPEQGDTWSWRAGKRVDASGNFRDRYLYLPHRLYIKYKSGGFTNFPTKKGFASKTSAERFVLEVFPGTDIKAFFDSFSWKIPAAKIKDQNHAGNKGIASENPQCNAAGCKAGNRNCSSLLEPTKPAHSVCDICCIEPFFCCDCCCILCSKTVNSSNGDPSFIRCEATVKDGFICGHICHIECALRSYMAGTVGGTIGLDAEYYCRRCDARTDLVPHVKNLLRSCESIPYGDKMHKILNLCFFILRGSAKVSAKALLDHVQCVVGKLKEGNSHEDVLKRESTSAVTTAGELSQYETDTSEVSNFKKHRISYANSDDQL